MGRQPTGLALAAVIGPVPLQVLMQEARQGLMRGRVRQLAEPAELAEAVPTCQPT